MTCEVDSEYTSLRLFDEALFVQFQVIKHLFEQSVRISSTFSTFIILKHETCVIGLDHFLCKSLVRLNPTKTRFYSLKSLSFLDVQKT